MKKQVLFVATLLFATQLTSAQILYSENFDNLTLGNIGTDFTGATPGQGGWHTLSQSSEIPSQNSNNYFKIVSEPGRGKVLELAATPGKGQIFLQKRDIDALWNNRTKSNNILKIEIDFYTGDQFSDGGTGLPTQGAILAIKPNNVIDATSNDVIGNFSYYPKSETFTLYGISNCSYNNIGSVIKDLKLKTWVKIFFYLDFSNQKYYTLIPSNNVIYSCTLDPNTLVSSFLLKNSNWIGSNATIPVYKYDNLIISAVNTVPLSSEDFISEKFNIYPNPVTNMLTVTTSENVTIKKLTVYDISGKTIKQQKGNFEKENTLNVDNLSAGTYILHIKTNLGIAVKSFIKK